MRTTLYFQVFECSTLSCELLPQFIYCNINPFQARNCWRPVIIVFCQINAITWQCPRIPEQTSWNNAGQITRASNAIASDHCSLFELCLTSNVYARWFVISGLSISDFEIVICSWATDSCSKNLFSFKSVSFLNWSEINCNPNELEECIAQTIPEYSTLIYLNLGRNCVGLPLVLAGTLCLTPKGFETVDYIMPAHFCFGISKKSSAVVSRSTLTMPDAWHGMPLAPSTHGRISPFFNIRMNA